MTSRKMTEAYIMQINYEKDKINVTKITISQEAEILSRTNRIESR